MRLHLFRWHRYTPQGSHAGRRIILPIWVPRYERFYDISADEFRYGFRVDSIALSFVRNRNGVRLGLDWGPFSLGQLSPSPDPVPWLA